jgi:squalene-hopene/tetraprenyl-beta-curcumene cyclase
MTGTAADLSATQRAAASEVTQRARRILLARQDSSGRWTGRSVGDVTLDAEAVLVREFLGVARPDLTRAAAQQIRSMQQPDGNWIGGASGDLAASVLAYLALRLAGDSPDAYHLAVAAGWIRDAGGLAAAGPVTSGWLATFGLAGWDEVRVPAPELIYLPVRYAPDDGDWTGLSRLAVVSLTVIGTLRPVRQLSVDVSELRPGGVACEGLPVRRRAAPVSVAQRAALRKSGQWLIGWQQRAGLPLGPRPYYALMLVALRALGYPLRHPVMSAGLSWLDSVTARPRPPAGPLRAPVGPLSTPAGPLSTPAGPLSTPAGTVAVAVGGAAGQGRIAAMRQPPVRDTTLTVRALADAGLPPSHRAMIAAGNWLLAQRITGPSEGPWPHPGAIPSGWSFGRDGYPVAADTAEVLVALSRIELRGMTGKPAITAALRWLTGAQARDGSWGRSAGATALVVQALATHSAPDARALRRGVVWLIRAQLTDGSWAGRQGVADLQATTDAMAALVVAGVVPGKPVIRSAVDWLLARQNPDGGWPSGAWLSDREDGTALPDPPPPSVPARPSDAAGTARAVAALLAACGPPDAGATASSGPAINAGAAAAAATDAGADWLMRAQRADGGWSDRPDAAGKPAGRNSPRRRGSLLPGMLLPLAALGQYAVSPAAGASPGAGASSGAAATSGAAASSGAAANADGAVSVEPAASAAAAAAAAGSADVSSVRLGASASVR